MTLSPFEVERQEFPRRLLGYRRDDVDAFLADVQDTLVGLWQDRTELREQMERLTERLTRYAAQEEQLQKTLSMAQESAEKATEQARREAELEVREANARAREIVHSAYEERNRLELAVQSLLAAEQEGRQRFRALGQAVITHLADTERAVSDASAAVQELASDAHEYGRGDLRRPQTPLSGRRGQARRDEGTHLAQSGSVAGPQQPRDRQQ